MRSQSRPGISFQAGASKAQGHANGQETTYANSQIIASDTLTTKSGGDTRLIGTQLAGNTVKMDVGKDLNIQSLQDTSSYDSKQTNASFGASVCVPPFCYGTPVTGSISAGKEAEGHDYASTTGQSGIKAGRGGFDIKVKVKGNTDLKGAALTSSAEKDKNNLSTGSLSFSDLQNKQTTSASSESISLGYGGASALSTLASNVASNVLANALGNAMGNAGLPGNQSQTSQTKSVISPGSIKITGAGDQAKDAQSSQSVATLTSRDASTTNGALTNTLTLQQAQALQAEQHKAKENAAAAQLLGSVMDGVIGDVGVKYGWAEGGPEKTALHGLSGLIQAKVAGSNGLAGLAAGAANEVLLPVISNYLVAQGYTPGTAEFNSLLTAGSTLVGAAVGAAAGSAGTGASVALTGTLNNYLKHDEQVQKAAQIAACKTDQCRRDVESQWNEVSQNRNKLLTYSCLNDSADQCSNNIEQMGKDLAGLQAIGSNKAKGYTGFTPEERNNIKQVMSQMSTNLESMAATGNSALGTTYSSPDDLVKVGILTEKEGQLLESARAQNMVGFLGAIALPSGTKGRNPDSNKAASLFEEMQANGIKVTPENVLRAERLPDGRIVFLEKGDDKAGLQHIMKEHRAEFTQMGLSEQQLPEFLFNTLQKGTLIGYQGAGPGRPIYETQVNGQTVRIAVTVGSNGFIVGANPRGSQR